MVDQEHCNRTAVSQEEGLSYAGLYLIGNDKKMQKVDHTYCGFSMCGTVPILDKAL